MLSSSRMLLVNAILRITSFFFFFFLNPDLYSAARTSWYRGGHVKLRTMLGRFVV